PQLRDRLLPVLPALPLLLQLLFLCNREPVDLGDVLVGHLAGDFLRAGVALDQLGIGLCLAVGFVQVGFEPTELPEDPRRPFHRFRRRPPRRLYAAGRQHHRQQENPPHPPPPSTSCSRKGGNHPPARQVPLSGG